MQYSDVLNDIKRGFMVVGLTGYTASGCSSFKNIIVKENKPEIPSYEHLEGRISEESYEKLKNNWLEFKWDPFIDIEVSLIIWLFVIKQSLKHSYKDEVYKNIREFSIPYKKEFEGIKYLTYNKNLRNSEYKSIITAYELVYSQKNKIKNYVFGRQNLYNMIKFLQISGNQIRKYGHPSPKKNIYVKPENITVFPEALRRVIKAYRKIKSKKYFVVDAFRNPFEVEYFKRRYKEFYLINVNRPKKLRTNSLLKSQMRESEFNDIYNTEKCKNIQYKSSKNIGEWITSQNIEECSQKAEYFINNDENTFYNMKFQAIKLISLFKKPGCIPPKKDEMFMQVAMSARQKSGCLSRKVGAVLVQGNRVIGIGWNDPPDGQTPCLLRSTSHIINETKNKLFSNYELSSEFVDHIKLNYKDHAVPFCFKDELQKIEKRKNTEKNIGKFNEFTRSLHAEERSFLYSNKIEVNSERPTLYTTDSPCTLCAKKSYHLNVKRIVYIEEYPGISNQQTLLSGERKDDIVLENFEGATGSVYFQLYEAVMPEKDYIKLFI